MSPRFRFNNPNLVRQHRVMMQDYPHLCDAFESITERGCCPETIWEEPELFRQYEEARKRFPKLIDWFTRLLDSTAITGDKISDGDPGSWLSGPVQDPDLRSQLQDTVQRAPEMGLRYSRSPGGDTDCPTDPQGSLPPIWTEHLPDDYFIPGESEDYDFPLPNAGHCRDKDELALEAGWEYYSSHSLLEMPDVLNVVEDFHAIGDGIVDDTEAIQNAIYSVLRASDNPRKERAWGGRIFFPQGTYRVTCPLRLLGYCGSRGIGMENFSYVVISLDVGATIVFDHNVSSRGLFEIDHQAEPWAGFVFLEGLEGGNGEERGRLTQAANNNLEHDGIRNYESNVIVRNLIIEGFRGNGIRNHVAWTMPWCYQESYEKAYQQGPPGNIPKLLWPQWNEELKDKWTKKLSPLIDRVVGCTIRNNHKSGIYAASGTGLVVEDCTIENNEEFGLYLRGNGISIVGNELRDNGGNSTIGAPYADLCVFNPGKGTTSVSITKNMFRGETTLVKPSVSLRAPEPENGVPDPKCAVFISNNHFKVDPVSAQPSGAGIIVGQHGTLGNGKGVTFLNATIVGNDFYGQGIGVSIGENAKRYYVASNQWGASFLSVSSKKVENLSSLEGIVDENPVW